MPDNKLKLYLGIIISIFNIVAVLLFVFLFYFAGKIIDMSWSGLFAFFLIVWTVHDLLKDREKFSSNIIIITQTAIGILIVIFGLFILSI